MSSGSTPQASLRRPDLWDSRAWEAYSAQYCGNVEPQPSGVEPGPSSGAEHAYSATMNPFKFTCAAGRVSRIKEGSVITLVFRGTCTLENAINDIWVGFRDLEPLVSPAVAQASPFDAMRLHRGFFWEYRHIRELPEVERMITETRDLLAENREARLLLTGHSLGGALATICLIDLLLNGFENDANRICLVTLGSPRVGNREFARWLGNQRLAQDIRVEIDTDLVTTVPDQNGDTYCHRGKRSLIHRVNGQYRPAGYSEGRVEEPITPLNHPLTSLAIWVGNAMFWNDPAVPVVCTSATRIFNMFGRHGWTAWSSHMKYWNSDDSYVGQAAAFTR